MSKAFNAGVVVGSTIHNTKDAVKHAAVATGHGVKVAAISTKTNAKSFWRGVMTGYSAPKQKIMTSENQSAMREVQGTIEIIRP